MKVSPQLVHQTQGRYLHQALQPQTPAQTLLLLALLHCSHQKSWVCCLLLELRLKPQNRRWLLHRSR
jgi:hypothetical protein